MDTLPDQNSSSSRKRFKAIAGHALTIVAALLALRITYCVPGFASDFKNYPFQPPWFSLGVVRFYPLLLLTAFGTLVAAIYVAWRYRGNTPPTGIMALLIMCIGSQALVIGYAMLIPSIKLLNTYTTP